MNGALRYLWIAGLGATLAVGPALADDTKPAAPPKQEAKSAAPAKDDAKPAAPATEQAKATKKKTPKKTDPAEKEGASNPGMRTNDQVRQDNTTRYNYDNARKTYK